MTADFALLRQTAARDGLGDECKRTVNRLVLESALEDQVRADAARRVTAGLDRGRTKAYFATHRPSSTSWSPGRPTCRRGAARAVVLRAETEPLHATLHELAAASAAKYCTERWRYTDCPAELRAALFDDPKGPPRAIGERVVRVSRASRAAAR